MKQKKAKVGEDMVECVSYYDKEGYLVKRSYNSVPIFIPKELAPQVQIIDKNTEWVTETFYMTKEEFNEVYKPVSKKE